MEELGNRQFQLAWAETRVADVDRYELELQYFDEPPIVQTILSEGVQRYEVSLRDILGGDVEPWVTMQFA